LPGLKSLFQYPPSANQPPAPESPAVQEPHSAPIRAENLVEEEEEPGEAEAPAVAQTPTEAPAPEVAPQDSPLTLPVPLTEDIEDDSMTAIWQKMSLLNEELAQTIRERDQAFSDSELLREQLRQADASTAGAPSDATKEEFARLIRERDEALSLAQDLRLNAQAPVERKTSSIPSFGKPPEDISKTKELSMLATERDQARKEYAELRKEFEAFKQGQGPKEESNRLRKDLEQQLEGFRQKLEEKNKEIAALKAGGAGISDEGAKAEIVSLREQLAKAKEESSVAQRGLALSQKALHETRDTLREATEGSSLSRHNFDNLKSECAALSQQNTVLQAQVDQLNRELGAARSKLTSRL
jgi:chromosome segregation ATPase